VSIADIFAVFEYVAGEFRRNIPQLQDEAVVEVVGQPGASKQELYFLAMAAANGMLNRIQPLLQLNPFLPPSAASLMIEYDAADHWVRCTLMYRSAAIESMGARVGGTTGSFLDKIGAFTGLLTSVINPVERFRDLLPKSPAVGLPERTFFDNRAVYRGPQCNVVGAPLSFSSDELLLPGIPGTVLDGAPKLPWDGKTILTSCPTVPNPLPVGPPTQNPPLDKPLKGPGPPIPSPNPLPSGDNRSRGSVTGPADTGGFFSTVIGSVSGGSPSGGSNSRSGTGKCCPKTQLLVNLITASLSNPFSNTDETFVPPDGTLLGR